MLELGVNIDHVATLRNARGGLHPDPLRAAQAGSRQPDPRAHAPHQRIRCCQRRQCRDSPPKTGSWNR